VGQSHRLDAYALRSIAAQHRTFLLLRKNTWPVDAVSGSIFSIFRSAQGSQVGFPGCCLVQYVMLLSLFTYSSFFIIFQNPISI